MSSNAFMLPALPQIPATGLNGTDTKGPAAFKSNPSGESSDPGKSFSATLNRISGRRYGSNHKATPAGKPGAASRGSNKDSAPPQKMSKTSVRPDAHIKEVETSRPKEAAPFICPLPGFGLMASHLVDFSISEDDSLAVPPQPGSTMAPGLLLLTDLIGQLHLQRQPVKGEQLSIGPFEQLQTAISPQAVNQAFLEQLVFNSVPQENSEGVEGKTARFFEFWQLMFPSPSTAADGAINGQTDSSGSNGNAPLNPLLHMQGLRATGPEALHLNAELLLKMATRSQPLQTEISENARSAVDGHEGRLSFWATGDANSETLLEAQARQTSENSQRSEVQTAIKSAIQKSEMLSVDTHDNKISQIDGDSKDSSLLLSQDQMSPKLTRLENGAQSTEATPRGLISQTLNQIVQKAVLSLHNAQHEIQLHLKPDYLGHIRMQIVSEGHQVGIKIAAEFPFVKDMLESNLHQLKADLLSQGLNIDELEVSVAHDFHAEQNLHQNAEAARLQAAENGTDFDDEPTETMGQAQSRDGGLMSQTAIDYFA